MMVPLSSVCFLIVRGLSVSRSGELVKVWMLYLDLYYANDDPVTLPTGFSGSKDINVLDNDTTSPEGVELEVVAIVNAPAPGSGFCTIPHDNNKVVEYYYPPGIPPFEGASCTTGLAQFPMQISVIRQQWLLEVIPHLHHLLPSVSDWMKTVLGKNSAFAVQVLNV